MSKTFRNIADIVVYLILFVLLQLIAVAVFGHLIGDTAAAITFGYGCSAVVTIALFHYLGWARLTTSFLAGRPYALLAWLSLLSLGLIAPSQYVEQFISTDMPDQMVEMLNSIISQPFGYMVIALLAPIAEEMVFRGAVLRILIRWFRRPWTAIVVSAVIFGAIHANIPQFLHALFMGLLLGWVFYRTESIVPGVVIHWVNNTVAFILCRIYPDKMEASLIDYFGNNHGLMYATVAVSSILCVVAFWQVWRSLGSVGGAVDVGVGARGDEPAAE